MRQTVYEFDWERTGDENEDELEFITGILEQHWNGEPVAVDAGLGLWYGTVRAGGLFRTLRDAVRGCNPTRIYVENGRVFIDHVHHDGTNTYELRQLTAKGRTWFENNDNGIRVGHLGVHLINTKGYTRRFIAEGGSL